MSAPTVGIQSPIPLIYLAQAGREDERRWDSVTYPLDILVRVYRLLISGLGFSHLSP